MKRRVLVLKGGGVKGYLQACCLAELESEGLDISGMDLKVGTSVGAINAAYLSCGKRAVDLSKMYPGMVSRIFKRGWFPRFPLYDRVHFAKVWGELIGAKKLGDVLGRLMITSVDRVEDVPHFFKSWESKDSGLDLSEVIQRSFAAPYYFGQLVDRVAGKVWLDGGVGIDNLPLEYALVEILLLGWLEDEVEIYSFGTGYVRKEVDFEKVSRGGVVGQVMDFIKPGSGGLAREMSSQEQVRRVRKVSNELGQVKYYHYDIAIPAEIDGMDKVKCLDAYREYGKLMAWHDGDRPAQ